MTTILLVVGILVFLIIVHELGHFAVAKFFKVKVEEFGVGYPPRALLLGTWGGTKYTLNWLPFGGFVRLYGEQGEGETRPGRTSGKFTDAPRFAQALILVAGVAMNALAAWFLFTGALMMGVPQVVEPHLAGENARLIVSQVLPSSPAAGAGLIAGDEIIGLRDVESGAEAALTPDSVTAFVSERGGRQIELTYERGGRSAVAYVYPAHSVVQSAAERPAIGVGLVIMEHTPLPFAQALREAGGRTIYAFELVGRGLSEIGRGIVGGNRNVLDEVVGPVGLVGIVGDASKHGIGSILSLAAFISVNLVIINLLPIPALDGGRLVLLGVESAMRRSAPRTVAQLLNALGVAFIIVLMVTVTYQDIARLLS
ncbi:hypothetical protein COU20_00205 [Candidatus Kaiserbacteria bacterium CG10_big_fil_rev_8_21_14_0_10_59_10]|uniref:PDZ domain-containing protein n=1 Tax=Candidatus Kaiserbacteria bacterium CG10_big_fil_rev_8_21_14_0_10_59_10 TaxID=1974612 RepID=A0A2H0U8U6_9BACT|nr:MAG: hypothetical protein COU20_00205 [Candidatus Kaiserbacteria bacterium CG10_big_fil_rev_8_21_14_0_10_59_10]